MTSRPPLVPCRWLSPTPPDVRRESVPCRMALVQLHRTLQSAAPSPGPLAPEVLGFCLFHLRQLYVEALRLYHLRDKRSRFSEWPQLHHDIVDLACQSTSPQQKMQTIERMMRSYAILQP